MPCPLLDSSWLLDWGTLWQHRSLEIPRPCHQACRRAMGSVPTVPACRCCCENEEESNFNLVPVGVVETGGSLSLVPLDVVDDVVPALQVLPPSKSTLLKSLDGRWFLKSTLRPLCHVWNSEVFFDPQSQLRDTVHFLVEEGPNLVSLQMNGQCFIGDVSLEAQAAILWNNGETWIKL